MAENKKSFLFYSDWGDTFDELTNEEAGQLIKHLCDYVRDKKPVAKNSLVKAVFANFKSTLKRDLDKWEAKSLKNSENAKIRWDKNKAKVCERIKPDANDADRDKDIVIVKDKVIDIKEVKEELIIQESLSEFQLKVLEFYNFRKSIRKPIVDKSKKAWLKKLAKLSNGDEQIAILIIDESIANGYQGIFELKTSNNGTTKNGQQISKYYN